MTLKWLEAVVKILLDLGFVLVGTPHYGVFVVFRELMLLVLLFSFIV